MRSWSRNYGVSVLTFKVYKTAFNYNITFIPLSEACPGFFSSVVDFLRGGGEGRIFPKGRKIIFALPPPIENLIIIKERGGLHMLPP